MNALCTEYTIMKKDDDVNSPPTTTHEPTYISRKGRTWLFCPTWDDGMIKEKVSPTILIRLTALKCKLSRVIQTKSGVHHALNKRFIILLVAQYVYMTTSSLHDDDDGNFYPSRVSPPPTS